MGKWRTETACQLRLAGWWWIDLKLRYHAEPFVIFYTYLDRLGMVLVGLGFWRLVLFWREILSESGCT
jgi:hypothetical protein